MVNLIWLMYHIPFQTFKTIFSVLLKKHESIANNPPLQICTNKIKNRIVFKINTGYKLELLSSETMKSLGSTEKDVNQDKDGENVPKLESAEVVLVHCNLVNNNYQQAPKVLFTFVPNKKFSQLINIAPYSLKMVNTTNTGFSFVEAWFPDQNSKQFQIEDNVNMTLIIR